MAIGFITRRGAPPTEPFAYTYTGESVLTVESDTAWNIKFLTSGTLTVNQNIVIDSFMCGGGSSGGAWNASDHGPGGGGGYTVTHKNITITAGTSYPIVIGAGGNASSSGVINVGGATSGFGASVNGGAANRNGVNRNGGNGGSGGAAQHNANNAAGTNGGNGTNGYEGGLGGLGQGTTTRGFGEAAYPVFADGGAGAQVAYPPDQTPNTGNGGTGGNLLGGKGGSGIVWIRSAR